MGQIALVRGGEGRRAGTPGLSSEAADARGRAPCCSRLEIKLTGHASVPKGQTRSRPRLEGGRGPGRRPGGTRSPAAEDGEVSRSAAAGGATPPAHRRRPRGAPGGGGRLAEGPPSAQQGR